MDTKQFSTLYGRAVNGKIKEWTIRVDQHSDSLSTITILNGYLDGKKAESKKDITAGKNIGKKNETTPYQQAVSEATRKWLNKKEKEGYVEEVLGQNQENDNFIMRPMLAQKYEPKSTVKKKKNIVFPCFVQPKLDGLRCIAFFENGEIKLMSRVGKFFCRLEHIQAELLALFSGDLENKNSIYFDGELYSEELPFEQITGICRNEKKIKSDATKIHYHIYDYYDRKNQSAPFSLRNNAISDFFSHNSFNYLKPVLTEKCDDKTLVSTFFLRYTTEGYEGIMLRNIDSIYTLKSRSHDLQKYKEFLDDEFKIVGFHESSGEDKGTIIWECEFTKNDGSAGVFSVKPRGDRDQRSLLFKSAKKDFSKYKGKQLTVRFQELTKENCPRFPVGIDIRYDI